jgi:hypothetical protein
MAIGCMGPRRIPIKEMAMALPIREGTMYHIVISKLFNLKEKFSSHMIKNGFRKFYPIAKSA